MAFHNVQLPASVAYGSVSGPGFSTIVQETASGHEVRVARQSQGRHRFVPIKRLQTTAEAIALKSFALARRGSLHSFTLHDWLDNTSNADGRTAPAATDQALGTGDGTEDTFALVKTYDSSGPNPYTRTITRPVSGSVVVAVAGTPTTAFSMDGGNVVLDTAPTLGQIVTAGFRFLCEVRFTAGIDAWARLVADAYDLWSAPDLECVEVLDESAWPETYWPGGDKDHGQQSADVFLRADDGVLHLIEATAAISAYLPEPDLFPGGPRIFRVHNKAAASNTVQVRNDAGTAVGPALSAGDSLDFFLSVSSGTAVWGAY